MQRVLALMIRRTTNVVILSYRIKSWVWRKPWSLVRNHIVSLKRHFPIVSYIPMRHCLHHCCARIMHPRHPLQYSPTVLNQQSRRPQAPTRLVLHHPQKSYLQFYRRYYHQHHCHHLGTRCSHRSIHCLVPALPRNEPLRDQNWQPHTVKREVLSLCIQFTLRNVTLNNSWLATAIPPMVLLLLLVALVNPFHHGIIWLKSRSTWLRRIPSKIHRRRHLLPHRSPMIMRSTNYLWMVCRNWSSHKIIYVIFSYFSSCHLMP